MTATRSATSVSGPSVGGILRRGWPMFAGVVLVNAVVQAATTLPGLTPSGSPGFVTLALVSFVAIVASVLLLVAQAHASAVDARITLSWGLVVASVLAVVLVAAAALVALPLAPVALAFALLVLPGAAGGRPLAGFRAFVAFPARANGRAVLTLVIAALLGVGALLLGFFVAGAVSAALVWILGGAVVTVVLVLWTALVHRAG